MYLFMYHIYLNVHESNDNIVNDEHNQENKIFHCSITLTSVNN